MLCERFEAGGERSMNASGFVSLLLLMISGFGCANSVHGPRQQVVITSEPPGHESAQSRVEPSLRRPGSWSFIAARRTC